MSSRLDTSPNISLPLSVPNSDGIYTLTTFHSTDINALEQTLSLPTVSDRLLHVPKPYTLDSAKWWVSTQIRTKNELLPISSIEERNKAFMAQSNALPLQIIRFNGTLIGSVTLTPRQEKGDVELGYYLHPSHQGKGIMRIASQRLLKYAAREWGVRKVYSSADFGNVASAKTIERLAAEGREVSKKTIVLRWPAEKRGGKVGEFVESESWAWEWEIDGDGED